MLDFHAQHNPNEPFAIFPSASGDGTTTLSYKELSDASHRIAHALRPGRAGPEGEVVGIIVNCDTIMYLAVVAGLTRAGMIVSITNSPYAAIDDTTCSHSRCRRATRPKRS